MRARLPPYFIQLLQQKFFIKPMTFPERYNRQINLQGFGMEAQRKLQLSKILVVGAGGLGLPAMQYLAAMGVGTIGIVDGDVVSASNLNRQILFYESEVGM